METLVVQGPNIAELDIEPDVQTPIAGKGSEAPSVDPAILSYGRSAMPGAQLSSSLAKSQPNGLRPSVPPSVVSGADTGARSVTPSEVFSKSGVSTTKKPRHHKEAQLWSEPTEGRDPTKTSATLTGPFSELLLDAESDARAAVKHEGGNGKANKDGEAPLSEALPIPQTHTERAGKRTRRGRRGKIIREVVVKEEPVEQQRDFRESDPVSKLSFAVLPACSIPVQGARKHSKDTGSNGWRRTPLIEDTLRTNLEAQPTVSHRSLHRGDVTPARTRGRGSDRMVLEEQNGWATEDATDIQDMGDFDFVGNLSKFDKREVFDQIRHGDTTADEERLVSYNRLPYRPGIAGGKNLHHTENVLSPRTNGAPDWNSEAGDSEEDFKEARISSGRSSLRNISRASINKAPSRKGSAMTGEQQRAVPRIPTEALAGDAHSPHHSGANSVLNSSLLPKPSKGASKQLFRLVPSGHVCPCLSPLQMLELEQLAISELDLSEDMITENASRGIAETVRKIISANADYAGYGSDQTSRVAAPLVVILAGNNKTGARAIAGGRQLCNHSTRVMVCVSGSGREDDLLDCVRRQLNIYRKSGGQVTSFDKIWKTLKYIKGPIKLIIDAVLGMHTLLDDLPIDERAILQELLIWVNGGTIDVLAIDLPSGPDALSSKQKRLKFESCLFADLCARSRW